MSRAELQLFLLLTWLVAATAGIFFAIAHALQDVQFVY
jgi:hypothetical protein